MNVAPGALEMCETSMSTNPFDNMINMSTKEGISVWKTATDSDKSLDRIKLTVENGNNFMAQMKSKCSEFD